MMAFASNSLLCRAALKETTIDAATFTSVRIISGALAVCAILLARSGFSSLVTNASPARTHLSLKDGNWISAFALFAYAAAF